MPSDGARSGAEVEALYQERILDHYRHPRNRGPLDAASGRAEVKNPLCGDEVAVQVALTAEGRVSDAKFTGQGCSIMVAAASMMTSAVLGLAPAEVDALGARVDAMLDGDEAAAGSLGDLQALSGVARYPARRQCARLPWRALEQALAGENGRAG